MILAEYKWEKADSSNPWGRKRMKGTHCSNGHEFTEENTFVRPYDKTRVCRECRRQYARKKYQQDKASGKLKPKKSEQAQVKIPDYLSLSEKSGEIYKRLSKGMTEHETECMSDPGPFVDYPEKVEDSVAEYLCFGCPLIKNCYDFAVSNKEEYGIWGGINFTKEVHRDDEWLGSEDPDTWVAEK